MIGAMFERGAQTPDHWRTKMDIIQEFVDLMNISSTEELYIFLDELNKEIRAREEEQEEE